MANQTKVVLHRIRELCERFQNAHRAGMAALAAGDLDGFANAIAIEREIIEEQERLIEETRHPR